MKINLKFSKGAWSRMPQGMANCIEHAAVIYDRMFAGTHVTLNLKIGFNHVGGLPLTDEDGAEGRANSIVVPYSTLQGVLENDNGGALLPATDPTDGAGVAVSYSEAKALGLSPPRADGIDGYVGFRYEHYYDLDPTNRAEPHKDDFVGIALHEISEAMGRRTDPGLGTTPNPGGGMTLMDLYRYTAPGELGVDGSRPAYFSMDGGAHALKHFDTSPKGDYGDWAWPGRGVDAYRGGITPDTVSPITHVDHLLMASLGFHH